MTPPERAGAGLPVATATARDLVQGLVDAGVRHVVLCPGSRSAPLAYALHAADLAGRLALHVRTDERAAAFTALGVGRAGAGPGVVVTTSGTAVANLVPAALEARHARVPLVVLTADRPARLRGTWANQTSDVQAGLFAPVAVRVLDVAAGREQDWHAVAAAGVAAARGVTSEGAAGVVHLNVGFDDPLVPPDLSWRPRGDSGRGSGTGPGPGSDAAGEPPPLVLEPGLRTVVVAGDGAGPGARILAEDAGWPLLAEPTSGARGGPRLVPAYRLVLGGPLGAAVQRVVVMGRPTLSRPVTALLGRGDVEVVLVGRRQDPGPARPVTRAGSVVAGPAGMPDVDQEWSRQWQAAGRAAAAAIASVLDVERQSAGGVSGYDVAAAVVAACGPGDGLMLAASNPIRDADLAAGEVAAGFAVANRGLSGIDGTMSTAAGMSLATGAPVRVLVGDLAFLHDANALLIGPGERRPDLQVVVLNDQGGGIFSGLEHGEERFAPAFERVFGTPQDVDLAALCAAHHVPHRAVGDVAGLAAALGVTPVGLSVVEVATSRSRRRALGDQLREAVLAAVS